MASAGNFKRLKAVEFDEAAAEEAVARVPAADPLEIPYEPPKVLIYPIGVQRKILPAYMGNQ